MSLQDISSGVLKDTTIEDGIVLDKASLPLVLQSSPLKDKNLDSHGLHANELQHMKKFSAEFAMHTAKRARTDTDTASVLDGVNANTTNPFGFYSYPSNFFSSGLSTGLSSPLSSLPTTLSAPLSSSLSSPLSSGLSSGLSQGLSSGLSNGLSNGLSAPLSVSLSNSLTSSPSVLDADQYQHYVMQQQQYRYGMLSGIHGNEENSNSSTLTPIASLSSLSTSMGSHPLSTTSMPSLTGAHPLSSPLTDHLSGSMPTSPLNSPSSFRKRRPPPTASTSTLAYANAQYTGRFILLEQPNIRQRKSYKNENRYLLPNPLTICAKDDDKQPKILDGDVTVSLVNQDGMEIVSKSNLLECPEGGVTQPLDSSLSTHFSLKVGETSEGTLFRLLFTVRYTAENLGSCEEKLLSRPFQVYSNRKKNNKVAERPIVIDLKPNSGPTSQETEIWIKGKGFGDKASVMVTFGDKLGRLVESSDNLLTVCAPPRFDIQHESTVTVVVSNKTPQELLPAEKKLSFVYYPA